MDGEQNTAVISHLIGKYAEIFKLPSRLVMAVCQHESRLEPLAIGDHGYALGLMQVHRAACDQIGVSWDALKQAIAMNDRGNAASLGLQAGCRYLAAMLKQFHGRTDLALMAYNQGPGVIGAAYSYAETCLEIYASQPQAPAQDAKAGKASGDSPSG